MPAKKTAKKAPGAQNKARKLRLDPTKKTPPPAITLPDDYQPPFGRIDLSHGEPRWMVSINAIHPDPANTNKHPAKQIAVLKSSLRRFGQKKPLVIHDDRRILTGNGNYLAMLEDGWEECWVTLGKPLSETDATAFSLIDNQSATLSERDEEAVATVLAGLAAQGSDILDLGYDEEALIKMGAIQAPVLSDTSGEDASLGKPKDKSNVGSRPEQEEQKWLTSDVKQMVFYMKSLQYIEVTQRLDALMDEFGVDSHSEVILRLLEINNAEESEEDHDE